MASVLGMESKEMADRMGKAVNTAKAAVGETIEDGMIAANKILKRGREAVADAVEDRWEQAIRQVKRNPGKSLAIAFAAGAALGILAPRLGKKITG